MDTGVIGNYYYDPETGEEGFIEERDYMKAETLLQYYKKLGKTTALLTVKGKVLGVYGDGADTGLSVQDPDEEIIKRYDLSPAPATAWRQRSGSFGLPQNVFAGMIRISCTARPMIISSITLHRERRRQMLRSRRSVISSVRSP